VPRLAIRREGGYVVGTSCTGGGLELACGMGWDWGAAAGGGRTGSCEGTNLSGRSCSLSPLSSSAGTIRMAFIFRSFCLPLGLN
jgi:hypothetical protein